MKRVLMIAYYTPPLGRGGVKRVSKFAKYLPKFGWQPVILSVKPIAYYAFDPSLLEDVKESIIIRTESLDHSRIAYLLGKRKVKASIFTEGFSRSVINSIFFPDAKIWWLPFAIKMAEKIKRDYKPDIIFSTSPPYTSHLIGLYYKKVLKVPLVVDFRDFWPTGLVPANPFMKPLYRKLRNWIAKRADHVIAVYQDIVEDIGFGTYLPAGYDPRDLKDLPTFALKGKIKFAYAGSLSLREKESQEFINALKDIDNGFTLHLSGVIPESLLKFVDGKTVYYHGYLPSRFALGLLKSADFLWYTQPEKVSATSKLYEYAGLGKPIFATIRGDTEAAKLIREKGIGIIVEPEREKIKQALQDLLNYKIKINPPKVIELSRVILTQKLVEIFESLLS